jgi:hypothetical protein
LGQVDQWPKAVLDKVLGVLLKVVAQLALFTRLALLRLDRLPNHIRESLPIVVLPHIWWDHDGEIC